MRITKAEYITGYTWSSTSGGTAGTFTKVLDEGVELPDEESIDYRVISEQDEQNGVRVDGSFRVTGSNLPTVGTPTWLRFTLTDGTTTVKTVYGGEDGCSIRLTRSGPKKLSQGPAYTTVMFSCTAGATGGCITDEA